MSESGPNRRRTRDFLIFLKGDVCLFWIAGTDGKSWVYLSHQIVVQRRQDLSVDLIERVVKIADAERMEAQTQVDSPYGRVAELLGMSDWADLVASKDVIRLMDVRTGPRQRSYIAAAVPSISDSGLPGYGFPEPDRIVEIGYSPSNREIAESCLKSIQTGRP